MRAGSAVATNTGKALKKSGYGRELSHFGLPEFTNVQTVWAKTVG